MYAEESENWKQAHRGRDAPHDHPPCGGDRPGRPAVDRRDHGIETEQLGRAARLIAGSINDVFLEEQKVAIGQALDADIVVGTFDAADGAAAAPGKTASVAVDPLKRATDRLVEIKSTKGVGESYVALMVVGSDGVARAASDPSYVGVNIAERAYFKTALAGTANAGDAVISKVTNKPIVPVAAPIRSGDRIVGVYVQILDGQFINNLILNEKIGKSGYAYVVDRTGLIIADPVAENVFKTNLAELDGTKEFTKKMVAGESGVSTYVFRGVAKTAGFAPVTTTGWSVGMTIPDVEYLAPAMTFATSS